MHKTFDPPLTEDDIADIDYFYARAGEHTAMTDIVDDRVLAIRIKTGPSAFMPFCVL